MQAGLPLIRPSQKFWNWKSSCVRPTAVANGRAAAAASGLIQADIVIGMSKLASGWLDCGVTPATSLAPSNA